MRRFGTGLVGVVVLAALVVVLGGGPASAAGPKKLVEGTVYDTTCATTCVPECPTPPCGPVPQARAAIVCAQTTKRAIACPLETAGKRIACVQAAGCYPIYSGEGAVVKVRRRGSADVIATVPIEAGHFKVRLGAGEWILRAFLPEEPCWKGDPATLEVSPRAKSPVQATIEVSDSCVAHPDAR